jgi:hypothetical protein
MVAAVGAITGCRIDLAPSKAMNDTPEVANPSPEPTNPGAARRRRTWIVSGAVAVAVLVLVAVGIAQATSSDSHPDATAKGAAGQGSTSSQGSIGGRSGATTSHSPRATSAGSPNKGPKGSGAGGVAATVPVAGGTTSASTGNSSATTPRGSTPTTRHGVTPTTIAVPVSIEQAYVQGFEDECRSLWAQAGPSGMLWDADSLEDPPHTIDECLGEVDPFYASSWSDYTTEEARAGGRSDADTIAAGLTVGNRFQTSTGLVVYIPDP